MATGFAQRFQHVQWSEVSPNAAVANHFDDVAIGRRHLVVGELADGYPLQLAVHDGLRRSTDPGVEKLNAHALLGVLMFDRGDPRADARIDLEFFS